jgi:type I restriction enzyme S subunit
VLYSSRAPIGYTVIASKPISTNQGFKNIIPYEGIFNEYLYHYLKSDVFSAESYASGTTFKELSATRMKQIPIPIPPYNEQKRIVNRIEELLTINKAGQKMCKIIQIQMNAYSKSLLRSAFIGELTKKWRNRNPDFNVNEFLDRIKNKRDEFKFKRRRNVENSLTITFPESWQIVKLDDIAMVADVDHKMPKDHPNGIPFLSPKDFEDPDRINLENVKTISLNDYDNLSKKVCPNGKDLLFSRIGTIGKVRRAPEIKFQASYSLCIIRTSELIKDYLYWILQAPNILHQAIEGQRSVGVPDLGLRDIRNFIIPFPPKKEQEKIVDSLESYFSIINYNSLNLDTCVQKSIKLRNSILKKAFEGHLVPHDPDDEPASVLLERINLENQGKLQRKLI